jgi:CheY-like chemotaxis protein
MSEFHSVAKHMSNIDKTKPRIAVLEDHDDTREFLTITLGDEFSVHEFGDAVELLAVLDREKFSAVVADIMLPGLDGYGFVRAVRTSDRLKDLCVIAVTALAMPGDREKALSAGFTDYLVKPVASTEIAAILWRCLEENKRSDSSAA